MTEKWDSVRNVLPVDVKECYVRLKRLTEKEIKMFNRCSTKKMSDSETTLGPPKKKFKRILVSNENSEDEDNLTQSSIKDDSQDISFKDSRISVEGERTLDFKKSEGPCSFSESIVKSKISFSNGGYSNSKNDSCAISDKKSSNFSNKDTKGSVKKHSTKIFGKTQAIFHQNSKPKKIDLKDSVIPKINKTNNHRKCLEVGRNTLPAINIHPKKTENLVSALKSANGDEDKKNVQPTMKRYDHKPSYTNFINNGHKDTNHGYDNVIPSQNKDPTCEDKTYEVERVLEELFNSPPETNKEEIFFGEKEAISTCTVAKECSNEESKSRGVIVHIASKKMHSMTSCGNQVDEQKDVHISGSLTKEIEFHKLLPGITDFSEISSRNAMQTITEESLSICTKNNTGFEEAIQDNLKDPAILSAIKGQETSVDRYEKMESKSESVHSSDTQKLQKDEKSTFSKTQTCSQNMKLKNPNIKTGINIHIINSINEEQSKAIINKNVEKKEANHAKQEKIMLSRNIKRSNSVEKAPVKSFDEVDSTQILSKCAVHQPSPVLNKFKEIDLGWMVSAVNEEKDESNDAANVVEIGNKHPETQEELHLFSKETICSDSLSKVIEKIRQKVAIPLQMKDEASYGSFLKNTNLYAQGQVLRTQSMSFKPSTVCDDNDCGKAFDCTGDRMVSTPKLAYRSEDIKEGNLINSSEDDDHPSDSSIESREKSPIPSSGIVAETIGKLMQEYELLTSKSASVNASKMKKMERRPSRKKLLSIFGEEHLIEDFESLWQIPKANKEKRLPAKQLISNEGEDNPSLAGKMSAVHDTISISQGKKSNVKYTNSRIRIKRDLNKLSEGSIGVEKPGTNSPSNLSKADELCSKELHSFQSKFPEEKLTSSVDSSLFCSEEVSKSLDCNLQKSDFSGDVSETDEGGARKLGKGVDSSDAVEKEIKRVVEASDSPLKIIPSESLNKCETSDLMSDSTLSKAPSLENLCENKEITSKVGAEFNEVNLTEPKIALNQTNEEKDSLCEIKGKDEDDSIEIIDLPDVKFTSQSPIVESSNNTIGCTNGVNNLCCATTTNVVKNSEEFLVNSGLTSTSRDGLTEKAIERKDECLDDPAARVSYADKLKNINGSLAVSLGLLSEFPVESLTELQETVLNTVDVRQRKTDATFSEYAKKLEQQHEMLEKLVDKAIAKKHMIWTQLQAYHGIFEVKKEVSVDSEDDSNNIFTSTILSDTKNGLNSNSKTEIVDKLDDSSEKNVDDDHETTPPILEKSETEHLNPIIERSNHSVDKQFVSNNYAEPSEDECVGSKICEDKVSRKISNVKVTSGREKVFIGKIPGEAFGDGISEAVCIGTADLSLSADAVITNTAGITGSLLIPQQRAGLEVAKLPEISGYNQPSTSAHADNIIISHSNRGSQLSCGSISLHNGLKLTKPIEKTEELLQSSGKEPLFENNGCDLSSIGESNLNFFSQEDTSVTAAKNSAVLMSNNTNCVGEERIRVRGIEDLTGKSSAENSDTTVECCKVNINYLRECFVSEDGVIWFNDLVSYMLKISKAIESFMEKRIYGIPNISEIEELFKDNCVIIYNLFTKVLIRYIGDQNSFITILFMEMVTQWKDFKSLLTLDSLKIVIKKCFAKCLELMSSGKHLNFISQANKLLTRLRISPPLDFPAQSTIASSKNRSVTKSCKESVRMNASKSSFTNVQIHSNNLIINETNIRQSGITSRPIKLPSRSYEPEHAQQQPHIPSPVNPNLAGSRNVIGESTNSLHPDKYNDHLSISKRGSDEYSSSKKCTQRNIESGSSNGSPSGNVSQIEHMRILSSGTLAQRAEYSASRHVQTSTPQNSSNIISTSTIIRESTRNILKQGKYSHSQQKTINPINTPHSSEISVTKPHLSSDLRPSIPGNYYVPNASFPSNGFVRSSKPSSHGNTNSAAPAYYHNASGISFAHVKPGNPAHVSTPERHSNALGLNHLPSTSCINSIMRQPIQVENQPQILASGNNSFSGMNGYQISCQLTVNSHIPYSSNPANLGSGGSSGLVSIRGQNSTGFTSVPVSQCNQQSQLRYSNFQTCKQNQQAIDGGSFSSNSPMVVQNYSESHLPKSQRYILDHQNPVSGIISGRRQSSVGRDGRHCGLENLGFEMQRTNSPVIGNQLFQDQSYISADKILAVHTYQQHNPNEVPPNNALLSRVLQPNFHSSTGHETLYPYSVSLMKQAEARSNLQLPLPGGIISTSPGISAEDVDQVMRHGPNRSISRDSGYRSPSQVNEAEPCFVCGKEARNTCSGCKSVFYCYHECQMGDWERHRWECQSANRFR